MSLKPSNYVFIFFFFYYGTQPTMDGSGRPKLKIYIFFYKINSKKKKIITKNEKTINEK